MKYVADTSAFNLIAEGKLTVDHLPPGAELVATHIQIDEINRTKNEERRGLLFLTFACHNSEVLPTETGVWGVSRWGQAKWGEGTFFDPLKKALDVRNGGKANNLQDALIAEVALTHGYGLVTSDADLAEVVRELRGSVVYVAP